MRSLANVTCKVVRRRCSFPLVLACADLNLLFFYSLICLTDTEQCSQLLQRMPRFIYEQQAIAFRVLPKQTKDALQ